MGSVLEKVAAYQKDQLVEAQLKSEEDVKSIKSEYGSAFEQRKELANAALRKFGDGKVAAQVLQNAGLQNNPVIFKLLSEVGKLIAEDSPAEGEGKGSTQFGMTPAEAQAQIQEIRNKKEYDHYDIKVRQPWIDKIQDLMKFAYPDASTGEEAVKEMRRGATSG